MSVLSIELELVVDKIWPSLFDQVLSSGFHMTPTAQDFFRQELKKALMSSVRYDPADASAERDARRTSVIEQFSLNLFARRENGKA